MSGMEDGEPEQKAVQVRPHRWRRFLVTSLFLGAAVLLPLLRQRGTASWQTVWAEDGKVFTQQAVRDGGFHVLFRGYNSYLELPSRILALPTMWFPLRYLALYAALSSTMVGALLAWAVYRWSRGWVSSWAVRMALSCLVVLMPFLGLESTASMTNVIWIFLAALPWALISLEEEVSDTVARSVVAALAAASSVLALAFLPLAIVWLCYRRTRAAIIVVASFVVGSILEGVVALSSTPPYSPPFHYSFGDLVAHVVEGVGGHVFGAFLLGTTWESDFGQLNDVAAVLVPTLVVLACFVALVPGVDSRTQVLACTCTVSAAFMFGVEAWGRTPWYYGLNPSTLLGNTRYSVAPVMLLAAAFALLVSPRGTASHARMRKIGSWLFVIQTVLVVTAGFTVVSLRSGDPPWIGRVDSVVVHECRNRPPSTLVTVPNVTHFTAIFGQKFPAGLWPVTVPCANLK